MIKKVIVFLTAILIHFNSDATITGMSPNSGVVGTNHLNTTITSNGTFVQAASPNGNVYEIGLRQGGTYYSLADGYYNYTIYQNTTIVDPNTLQLTDFSLPYNAPTGSYTLVVGYLDPMFQMIQPQSQSYDSLQNAFTILPPDGYLQGTIFEDINQNGQRDAGEPPFVSGQLLLNPGGTYYSLTATGDFSIPVSNGNYTVTYVRSSGDVAYVTSDSIQYTVTVNAANVTGLDFGVHRKLTGIFPNQVVAGQQVRITVVGDTLFSPGTNLLYSLQLRRTGSTITTYYTNITVIDTATASALVSIPVSAAGMYSAWAYISGGVYSGQHYLANCLTVLPPTGFFSGHIYFDSNNNGVQDPGEAPLSYQRLHLMPDDAYGYTDANGNYAIGAAAGTHTVSWAPASGSTFVLSSPNASWTGTLPGTTNGFDFGLRTTNPDYTCTVSITPTFPRCNTNNMYFMTCQNNGNIPFDARLYLLRDAQTVYNGSTVLASGSTATGDSIWWNFPSIQPFAPTSVRTALLMPGAGSTVSNAAYLITYDANGITQRTAYQYINEVVRCSFDPNDKACTPEGVGLEHFTLTSADLEYKIRFQNTGNDTAYDVRIYDQLDTSLDWTSLEILESSHSVRTTLDTTGQLTFYFEQIYLPDSNVNEPESNGFVRYRIRAKSTSPDFTVINNTAYIVFDLNPAVVTNTTYNTLVQQIPLWASMNLAAESGVVVYPNPFHSQTSFRFPNQDGKITGFQLYDLTGKCVFTDRIRGDQFEFSGKGWQVGMYFYRLIDGQGESVYQGKIILE